MKTIPCTHRIVDAVCAALVLGGVAGVAICLTFLKQPSLFTRVITGLFALAYAGMAVAACGLWRGKQLGLHWTRLLLLAQVPLVQTPLFIYGLSAGAAVNVYVGTNFGIGFEIGSRFSWWLGFSPQNGWIIGANVVPIALFLLLHQVRIEPDPDRSGDAAHELLATPK